MPTETYTYSSNSSDSFIVPSNQTITIEIDGAQGGPSDGGSGFFEGPKGGRITVEYAASEGEVLELFPAQRGGTGHDVGSGGGGFGGWGWYNGGAGGDGSGGGDESGGGGAGSAAVLDGSGSLIAVGEGGGGACYNYTNSAWAGFNEGGGGGGARGGAGGSGNDGGDTGSDAQGSGNGGDGMPAATDGISDTHRGGVAANQGTVISSSTGGGTAGDAEIIITYQAPPESPTNLAAKVI